MQRTGKVGDGTGIECDLEGFLRLQQAREDGLRVIHVIVVDQVRSGVLLLVCAAGAQVIRVRCAVNPDQQMLISEFLFGHCRLELGKAILLRTHQTCDVLGIVKRSHSVV
ncbi:hypothetical protein SDC9_177213 [bioreactor metagenome]|uniref:Uncharacterized protein n=1 Tax=bioreactor metagenome TaxID=1076179 RepID=A0A645GTW6_9ZZZZ